MLLGVASLSILLFTAVDPSLKAGWDRTLQAGRNAAKAGELSAAEQHYREALAIAERGLDPGRLANSLNHLAALLLQRDQAETAAPLFTRALEIYRSESDWPNAARALNNLASVHQMTGRRSEAEVMYREALAMFEKSGTDHEGSMIAASNLATLAGLRADFNSAIRILEEARSKWIPAGREPNSAAAVLNQLGVLYRRMGRLEDAEPVLRLALEIRIRSLGPDHIEIATVLNNLGDLMSARGRLTESEELLKRATKICRAVLGSIPRCAGMLTNLGSTQQALGRLGEAENQFRDSIEILERSSQGSKLVLAAALNNLAKLYVEEKRYAEAKPLYERALTLWEAENATNHPDYASTLTNMAALETQNKDFARAEVRLRRALEIDEGRLGANHWKTAVDLNNLASVLVKRKRYEEAEPLLRRVLEIAKTAEVENDELARALANLGELLALQGRNEEAALRYRAAVEYWDKHPGSLPDNHLALLVRYEQLLRALEEFARAEEVSAKAMRIRVRAAVEKSALPK